MKNPKLHLRALATFAKSADWEKHLKPELLLIKSRVAELESAPVSVDEAAIRDVQRSTTNNIIMTIIRLVERAEGKIK